MEYKKATDLLPEELLRAVQKYVQGETIYIPTLENKEWGEKNGTKEKYIQRNNQIRKEFQLGQSISDLSRTYFLSEETIKKIVYKKVTRPN